MRLKATNRLAQSVRSTAWILRLLFVVLCFGYAPSEVEGGLATQIQDEIQIVLSTDNEFYRAAANAAEASIKSSGKTVVVLTLEQFVERGGGREASSWIGVGPRATKYLTQLDWAPDPVYYCLVPRESIRETGKVSSLAGVLSEVADESQIELMREAAPEMRRIVVFYRGQGAGQTSRIAAAKRALPSDIELLAIDLDTYSSAMEGVRDALKQRVDFVWMIPDSSVYSSAMVKAVLLESLKRRIPVFGFSDRVVRAGCLIGTGVDPARQGRRVAEMLLSGTRSHVDADPIIAANQVVAERLDRKLPRSLLSKADVVFDGSGR